MHVLGFLMGQDWVQFLKLVSQGRWMVIMLVTVYRAYVNNKSAAGVFQRDCALVHFSRVLYRGGSSFL